MSDNLMNRTHVVLPRRIWQDARDKEHFKQLVQQYMRKYPGYTIKKIDKYYAICEVIK